MTSGLGPAQFPEAVEGREEDGRQQEQGGDGGDDDQDNAEGHDQRAVRGVGAGVGDATAAGAVFWPMVTVVPTSSACKKMWRLKVRRPENPPSQTMSAVHRSQ